MSTDEPTRVRGEPSTAPTQVQPAPPERVPARVPPRARRGVVGVALATTCGFLLGVLVVTTLGPTEGATVTQTQRVTVLAPTLTTGGTIVVRTPVPAMVGQPLDVAKQRAARAKFTVTVDVGGGLFGVVRVQNWEVVAQRPGAGELLEQGSTVHVDIVKR